MKKHDCCLIQIACGDQIPLVELTRARHEGYCLRHKIDYRLTLGPTMCQEEFVGKWFDAIDKALNDGYEYVTFLDADACIADDTDIREACPPDAFGLTWHDNANWGHARLYDHFNIGCFYIGNGPRVREFFTQWMATPFVGHPWGHQHTFNRMQKGLVSPFVVKLPHAWNSTPYYNEPGKPVHVLAWHGYGTMEQRYERMKRDVERLIVSETPVVASTRAQSDTLLIQQATGPHVHLLNLVLPEHAAYCQRWDIDYWPVIGSALAGRDKDRHSFWNKVALIRRGMDAGYSNVVWLDSDCYVADPEIDIREACEPNTVGMVRHEKPEWPEHKDCYSHFNAGAIYCGAGPDSKRLIEMWWKSPDDGHFWHDQHALNRHAIPGYEKLTRKDAPLRTLGYEWNAVPIEPFDHPKPIVRAWHGWHSDMSVRIDAMTAFIAENKLRIMLERCSDAEACQKADFCLGTGQFDKAVRFFKRAEELGVSGSDFYGEFGRAHSKAHQWREAAEKYRKALDDTPDKAALWAALASCCDFLGEHEQNGEALKKAESLAPGWPHVMHNKTLWQLRDGQWSEGFDGFKWQYLINERVARVPGPEWNFELAPRLFVWAEQGLGDTIMLSRFVRDIDETLVGKVIFEVQPPLAELFAAQCWPRVEVVPKIEQTGVPYKFDAHIGTFTLLNRFQPKPDDDSQQPYLKVPAERVEKWAARMATADTRCNDAPCPLRIGFSWAGSQAHGNNANRNLTPNYFNGLFPTTETAWYCLQRDLVISEDDKDDTPQVKAWIGDEFEDMADTAGALANLDLVITVDSAIAHLCGAMGTPCWTLVSKSSDWRWLVDREDTPWYSNMRLFRQRELGNWSEVIGRVQDALKETIDASRDS